MIVIDHTNEQAIVFLLELEALLHVLVIKGTKLTKFPLGAWPRNPTFRTRTLPLLDLESYLNPIVS